ncbi:MAG: mannose-6-phosphate isomerase, class I, partial [Mycobacteriales bacterium]
VAAAARRAARGSGRFGADLAAIADIADHFPGDRGVVLSLLLNHVRLAPGEAVFVPAGMLHAHLRGFGVEVMAGSDNVVRCGLTPKHIDVGELLALIAWDFDHVKPLMPTQLAPGVLRWTPPVSEFMLTRVSLGPKASMTFGEQGPQLALCLSGEPLVGDDADELRLGSGQAAYSSAAAGPARVSGEGTVFIVGLGR